MVTIFQFNAKSDCSQMITDLTKDVSRFLLNDSAPELEQTSGDLSVQGMSAISPFMAKLGKDVSSSPGSTLSETATGVLNFYSTYPKINWQTSTLLLQARNKPLGKGGGSGV